MHSRPHENLQWPLNRMDSPPFRKRWVAGSVAATLVLVVYSFWASNPDATVAVFGCGFVGFCIWLCVRIVNRRERWAKRLALCLTVAAVIYPLSWPIWLNCLPRDSINRESGAACAWGFYGPLVVFLKRLPESIRQPYVDYFEWMAPKGLDF